MELFNVFPKRIEALPPEWQTKREIEAIKKNPELVKKIGNSLYEIKETEGGYLIVTDWCEVFVEVRYEPREDGIIGPAQFKLVFGDVVEKDPLIH